MLSIFSFDSKILLWKLNFDLHRFEYPGVSLIDGESIRFFLKGVNFLGVEVFVALLFTEKFVANFDSHLL